MTRPISSLALVSGPRSRSNRPANGLSITAATATLRSGGSIVWPDSMPTSSQNVSVRLICITISPLQHTAARRGDQPNNYLTALAIQARYLVLVLTPPLGWAGTSETEFELMERNAKGTRTRKATAASRGPRGEPTRKSAYDESLPLTISRPELLSDGQDRQFRHLVHSLFGFAAHHERIRSGHARLIGLAG